MLEFLRSLALSVSGIVVFGSLCEMILPSGAYKKYIHLLIGIVLVVAVLSPVLNFQPQDEISYAEIEDMEETQKDDVIRLYKKNLAINMKNQIKDVAGVDFEIKCDVCEDENDFGKIKNIWIIVDAEAGIKISDAAVEMLMEKYGQNITVKYLR